MRWNKNNSSTHLQMLYLSKVKQVQQIKINETTIAIQPVKNIKHSSRTYAKLNIKRNLQRKMHNKVPPNIPTGE